MRLLRGHKFLLDFIFAQGLYIRTRTLYSHKDFNSYFNSNMQVILDIDLDFFLDKIFYCETEPRGRLANGDYAVEPIRSAKAFLKESCGLSEKNPIPGYVCIHHKEVFLKWHSMINQGLLKPPFEVFHIDAHADLGFGDKSCLYIMEELLHKPALNRFPKLNGEGRLDNGNFLAFAAACQWLSKVTYVTHPKWDDDIQWVHMKDFSKDSGFLQLKKMPRHFAHKLKDPQEIKKLPFEPDPLIPFEIIPRDQFSLNKKIDFAFLSQSPPYTPRSADKLFHQLQAIITRL